MDRLNKKITLLLALLSCAYSSTAQNSATLSAESLFVQTNATVLVTGETLYYKLYCLNQMNTISDISQIAYVELVNSQKESVLKTKIKLDKGLGNGDSFLPTTLSSGNYKLIAYTNWMLNNRQNTFFEIDLTILNPFQKNLKLISDSTIVSYQTTAKKDNENSLLILDKEKYSKREKVSLFIPQTLERGNYVLSVKKIDNIPVPNYKNYSIQNQNLNKNLTYLPETRGELVTGSIRAKNETSVVSSKIVTLSISDTNFIYKTTKTDENGKFIFLLDKQTSNTVVYLQLSEADRENYTIKIDKKQGPNLSSLNFSKTTSISAKNLNAIQERSLATQIENVYFMQKKDSIFEAPAASPFFHPTEKRYNLDDYDRFRTFKETIIEIVLELSFKEYNKVPSLYLNDSRYNITQSKEPCLVLVDGLQIQDMNAINNFSSTQIESISVVTSPYYYGPKLFNGIVSICTKNKDFASSYLDKNVLTTRVLRPQPDKIYYQPNYQISNYEQRIPDYRYQLLWEPNLTSNNIQQEISFYSSDITGNFEIVLEGLSEEGKLVRLTKTLLVK